MCHFVTMVFAADSDLVRAGPHFENPLVQLDNPCVQAQLEEGERFVFAPGKHCDCGTVIGSAQPRESQRKRVPHSQIAKLERKGWGKAKIEKWLENKSRVADRRESAGAAAADASQEAVAWVQSLTGVVECGATDYVGVLLHWFSGDQERESLRIRRRERIAVDRLTSRDLAFIEEDVLYVVGS